MGGRVVLRVMAAFVGASAVLTFAGAASAATGVVELAQVGSCVLSLQDTTASGIAYYIVEPIGTSGHACEMVISDSSGATIADVTTFGIPAVAYLDAAGSYQSEVFDVTQGSTSVGFGPAVNGSPTLPTMPTGAASSGACTRGLDARVVTGAVVPLYDTGWNIVSATQGAVCTNQVNAVGAAGSATVALARVQIAVPDSYSIGLAKSVTDLRGAAITTAAVGETVRYVFTITNAGAVPWTVSVADPQLGLSPIGCPTQPLVAGGTEQCVSTYTVTAADATAGTITNTATATGVDDVRPFGTGASVTSAPATVVLAATIPSTANPTPTSTNEPTTQPGLVPTSGPSSASSVTSGASSGSAPPNSGLAVTTSTDAGAVSGPPTQPRTGTHQDALASTGSSATPLVTLASVLIAAGITLLIVALRRSRP